MIKQLLASILTALFYVSGFEPFGIAIAPLFCLVYLFYFALNHSPKKTAIFFYLFGFFCFSIGLYWLYISIHIVSGSPLWLAILLIGFLSGVMAIFYCLIGYIISYAYQLFKSKYLILTLLAPAIWTLSELLRGYAFTGFTWLTIGYSQSSTFLSAWAPIGGVYLVSFFVSLIAGYFLLISSRIRPLLSLFGVLMIIGSSFFIRPIEWTERVNKEFSVALVQGAVAQEKKWLTTEFIRTLTLYRNSLLDLENTNLVIWPEVAIPAYAENVEGYLDELEGILKNQNIDLLMLGINTKGKNDEVFNSVITLGSDDNRVYHKRHLVPFGEYFPVPSFVREWLQQMNLPNRDISKGSEDQEMPKLNEYFIATSICYEDIFGYELHDFMPLANVLVNVTNNAWFGESIASSQHFQMSRMRAIETGRYLLRSTNTGITAIVMPDGNIQKELEPYNFSILKGNFYPMKGETPYSRFGDLFVILLMTLIMTLGCFIGMLRLKNKNV